MKHHSNTRLGDLIHCASRKLRMGEVVRRVCCLMCCCRLGLFEKRGEGRIGLQSAERLGGVEECWEEKKEED